MRFKLCIIQYLVYCALSGIPFTLNAHAAQSQQINLDSESAQFPSSTKLKKRQPNWTPKILEYHSNGSPKNIVLFAPRLIAGLNPKTHPPIEYPEKILEFYPNGILKSETDIFQPDTLNSPMLHGVTLWNAKDGHLEAIGFYEKGLLQGSFRFYDSDNTLRKNFTFAHGVADGPFELYDAKGNVIKQGAYQNGKKHGSFVDYHRNGNKARNMVYVEGFLEGQTEEWDDQGILKTTKHYFQGLLHDSQKQAAFLRYYNADTKQEEMHFQFGEPHGEHTLLDQTGKVRYKVEYSKGRKVGEENYYFADGSLQGTGKYLKGVPTGHHYLKYPNGQIAWEAFYDNTGKLTKPIVEFDAKGQKTAEYYQIGKLLEGFYKIWHTQDNKEEKDSSIPHLKYDYNYHLGLLEGEQKEFSFNGTMTLKAYCRKNDFEKTYEEWHSNQKPSVKAGFLNGQKDGLCSIWNEEGQLLFQALYKNGLKSGPYKEWFPNGQAKVSCEYFNDKEDGEYKRWNENGQLLENATYKKGEKNGLQQVWDDHGTLIYSCNFILGKKEGNEESFFHNGQIASAIKFKNNILDGKVSVWDENGTLIEEKHFEDGKPIGKHTSYYANGSKQSEHQYIDGVLQGDKFLWDGDGNLIEEAHYIHGKLEGKYYLKDNLGEEVIYHYQNNLPHGLHQIYYPQDSVQTDQNEENDEIANQMRIKALEAHYADGLLEGEVSEFNKAGIKVSSTFYHLGLKEGLATLYTKEGQVLITSEFSQDRQNGPTIKYFQNGNKAKEVNFVNDVKEGQERSYYENGQLASIVHYKNGLMDGLVEEWTPEGVKVFEAEYKEGLKHGKFHKFDEQGNPKVIREYENNTYSQ